MTRHFHYNDDHYDAARGVYVPCELDHSVPAGGATPVTFTVPGEPKVKSRPRTVRDRRGQVRTYTPTDTTDAETAIGWAYRGVRHGPPATGRIGVHVHFYCSRPGDIDNRVKTVLDGLNKVAYLDDAQVKRLVVDMTDEGVSSKEARTVITVGELHDLPRGTQ